MNQNDYNEAYNAGYAKAHAEKRAHVQGLCDMNLQLLQKINGLQALIVGLAMIPADDFYKPGDYASGLVNEAWVKAREFA
jgi:hypothetical protein